MYLNKIDGIALEIIKAAFPSYNGKTAKVETLERINVKSCWDGGSRSYFAFVRLSDYAVQGIPQQSAFDKQIAGADDAPIPPGFVCVEHSIFRGKDMGITIYVNPANAAGLIPATTASTLSTHERIVLIATCSLKSSYGGKKNLRFYEANRETGISEADYDAAKASLIAKGMLNKAGAVTADGRNEREQIANELKRHSGTFVKLSDFKPEGFEPRFY